MWNNHGNKFITNCYLHPCSIYVMSNSVLLELDAMSLSLNYAIEINAVLHKRAYHFPSLIELFPDLGHKGPHSLILH